MIKLNDILNEGKRISFRDMGISNLMDLKLYTDKLAKANIGWDQKGQALVFNNTNDAKKARQLLGLDEGVVTEAKGGWALYIDGEKIKSFRSYKEALRALQLVQLSDNSVELKAEGKVNEARASAVRLLKDVVKGSTSSVEGIKLSKDMAQAYLDWISGSTYGKKFGALPWNQLFDASFNWGIERYAKGKLKGELKELKAKAKEMSESVNEADIPEFSTKSESIEHELNKIGRGVRLSEKEPGAFRAQWKYDRIGNKLEAIGKHWGGCGRRAAPGSMDSSIIVWILQ